MVYLMLARKVGVLLTWLLVTLLVAHCGRGDDVAPMAATQPVELRWLTFDPNSKVEALLVEKYREAHPAITFQREQFQMGQDYFSDPEVPDLIVFSAGTNFEEALRKGQLADLSEVWNEAELEGKLLANIEALVTNKVDGQRYLLPTAFSWVGFYYNKAVFERYALTPPQSWEEFLQICATLYNNAERPLAIPGPGGYSFTLWFDYLNLRINGAEFQRGLQAGRERYDDPRVYQVLETLRMLFEEGYVVESARTLSDVNAIYALVRSDDGLLQEEEAVMVLADAYLVGQAPANFREEFGFFPFPVMDATVPNVEALGVLGYAVPATSDHRAEAQYFLAYLSSVEGQTLLAQESLVEDATLAPVRTDLDETQLTPDVQRGRAFIQVAEEVVPFSFASMPNEMWAGFATGYQLFLASGYDPQPFVEALEKARQTAIESGAFSQ